MMHKEIYNEKRSKIWFAAISLFVLLIIMAAGFGIQYFLEAQNAKQIHSKLEKLTYTEENVDKELQTVQELMGKQPLSDASSGEVYQAAAELSYMTGDDMMYNHYVASALYYLRKVQDEENCVYLTNKYFGRLYANGCYDSAWQVLEGLRKQYDMSKLSLEVQASYYLSCADVCEMTGKTPDVYLENAGAAILLLPEGSKKKIQQAKKDLLSARQYILIGKTEQAEEIMSQYSEEDDFGFGKDQVYVVCDFTIPYYEIMAKISLNCQEREKAYRYVDTYLEKCDAYGFREMKLQMLQYVIENDKDTAQNDRKKYEELEKSVVQENLAELKEEYGQFLLSDMDNITDVLKQEDAAKERTRHRLLLTEAGLYLAILLYCMIKILMDSMNRDVLTGLSNRKKYEQIRIYCEKKKIAHGMIILDIDDFKKINDTFGHEQGDEVLRVVAAIVKSYEGRGIASFRYGGEEICLMLLNVPKKRTCDIAEDIRARVERETGEQVWHVTVSIGVAMSADGQNVFQEADGNLYQAKAEGKNRVC